MMSHKGAGITQEQFVATILHVLDMCHLALDADPVLTVDKAAHLRKAKPKATKTALLKAATKRGAAGGARKTSKSLDNSCVAGLAPRVSHCRCLFFRWRFRVSQQPILTDIRHVSLFFEKRIMRDVQASSLQVSRQMLKSFFLAADERTRVHEIEGTAKNWLVLLAKAFRHAVGDAPDDNNDQETC